MANKFFCHSCGLEQKIGSSFCYSCGTNLKSLGSAPPKPVERIDPIIASGDDDDDSYIDRLTSLQIRQNALQLEIIDRKPMAETVGSNILAGMSMPPTKEDNYQRGQPYKEIDQKTFLEQFKKEAGTLRDS